MPSLFLAVVCSVLVSVLLKLAGRARVDVGQAIAWNYLVALVLAWQLLRPDLAPLQGSTLPWWTLAALGVLLPTIFLALAASVREAGIVRSDAAQRLSLVLPLVAAFTLFGQQPERLHLAGAAVGLVALGCLVWRGKGRTAGGWAWPLLVFAGFGVIDILFKRVAATGLPFGSQLMALFALALLVALAIEIGRRTPFAWRNAAAGLLLGLANFGNILFYLKAHRALPGQPALVFAGMNLGVVVLGTVVGVAAFREKLARANLVGVLLALVAIGLLAWR